MKKIVMFCMYWLVGFCLPVNAYSSEDENYFKVGVDLKLFGYKEFDEKDILLDREDGLLPGVSLEIGDHWQGMSGALRFSLFDGLVDYDGQTQSGIPLTTKTDERITVFEALLRFKLSGLEKNNALLVAGVGHREWRRNIRATSITNSLFEIYRWKYLMLGGEATLWQRDRWSLAIDLRWMRPLQPTMSVEIVGYDEAKLSLGSRDSLFVNVPIRFASTSGGQWTISPYWESWRLGRSGDQRLTINGTPTATTVHEPRSETTIFGMTVSLELQ